MLKDKHAEIASTIEKKKSELRALENDPQRKVQERLSELDEAISQVDKHDTTEPDNQSVREHLLELRKETKQNPEPFVTSEKQRIRDSIQEKRQYVSNIGSALALQAHYPQIPSDVVERGVVDGVDMTYYVEVFEDTPALVWYYLKDSDTVYGAYVWSGEYSVDEKWFDIFEEICKKEGCDVLELEPSNEKVAAHAKSLGFELEDGVIYYRH